MHLIGWALLFAALTLVGTSHTAHAQIYVDANATGADNGTSWADAYPNLQDALGAASSTDEIWIAEGTYYPDQGTGVTLGDRNAYFEFDGTKDGLTIYGGFQSGDTFADRDPAANPTILSGDIGTAGDASDNSYHVVFLNGFFTPITTSTVLDGLTIRAGNANGGGLENRGGGLLCEGRGNSGGACSPTLTNVTFADNRAAELGGGLYAFGQNGDSSPVMTNVTFENNTAGKLGGGLYSDGSGGMSSPSITGSTFASNTANSGGAIYNDGGFGGTSSPTINNVLFEGNTAIEDAGVDGNGAAIFNNTSDGSAVSSPEITNSVFVDNTAQRDAGAIFNDARNGGISSPTLTNLVIANNNADSNGGAVYNLAGNGGTSSPVVTNVTFTGNTAGFDGGAMVNDILSSSTGTAQPTITNTIFFDNVAPNVGDSIFNRGTGAEPAIRHSLFTDGVSNDVNGTPAVNENNLAGDPLFANASTPAGPDGTFATNDDGLRLTSNSPTLDRGSADALDTNGDGTRDITTDFTGGDRAFAATVDLGAYERRQYESTGSTPATAGQTGFFQLGSTDATVLFRENTNSSGGLSATKSGSAPSGPTLPSNLAPATWEINSTMSGGTVTYSVTFDLTGVPGINSFTDLSIFKSDDGGSTWTDLQGAAGVTLVYDPVRNRIAADGLDSFSLFAVGGGSNPLPVELAGFEAKRSGHEAVTLRWETLSETNNAGFEVQRSAASSAETPPVETPQWDVSTGESWHTIARLDGAGTTDTPQSYRFEDADLPYAADSLSYRLRQIDADGTESFSEPVTVTRQVTQAELLPTYPNPVRGQTTIRYAVPEQQDVRIELYDMLGRRVQTVVNSQAEGRPEAQLDVRGLASGTYFLRMQTEGQTETQRVTVVR
ncbi:T9SS type A sorting domain-containing protein [Longimonas halophila]|uniref:T9SS type A sorting domain-containing protein n=1 Tax=Longimonas halophila TaxID=1469170 RepID=UPI0015970086|nr:T9SS type A sorting domain-containing protein [Longimonas halophila]